MANLFGSNSNTTGFTPSSSTPQGGFTANQPTNANTLFSPGPSTSLFGNTSNPSTSLFGSNPTSASGPSLFSTQTGGFPSNPGGITGGFTSNPGGVTGGFSNPGGTTGFTNPSSTSVGFSNISTSPGCFPNVLPNQTGGVLNPSPSVFGKTPAGPTVNNPSSLFGNNPSAPSTSLFGNNPTVPSSNAPGGLFGTGPLNTTPSINNALFAPASTSLFGGPPVSQITSVNPGFPAKSTENPLTNTPLGQQKAPGGLFGNPTSNPNPSSTEAAIKTIQDHDKALICKQRADWNLKETKTELEKQFLRFKDLSQKTKEFESDNYSVQNNLIKLNETLETLKKSQNTIHDELSMIEAEQESYNGILETINRELDTNYSHLFRYQGESTIYDKSAEISSNIRGVEECLQGIVLKLNENSEEPEPYSLEIEANLDALLDSLNWIEGKIVSLDSKVLKLG